MGNIIFVGLGGLIGSVLRYLLGLIPISEKTSFPWITMGINILGAFAIGFLSACAAKHGLGNSKWILLLKTGVCGGFTTFSTFALESSDLLALGKTGHAAAYIILSVICSLGAVTAGKYLASVF